MPAPFWIEMPLPERERVERAFLEDVAECLARALLHDRTVCFGSGGEDAQRSEGHSGNSVQKTMAVTGSMPGSATTSALNAGSAFSGRKGRLEG